MERRERERWRERGRERKREGGERESFLEQLLYTRPLSTEYTKQFINPGCIQNCFISNRVRRNMLPVSALTLTF